MCAQFANKGRVMQIQINGHSHEVPSDYTVSQLLTQMQLQQKRLAVEVNEAIIPRSLHHHHKLQAGDKVEIVHAIGGG